MFLYVPSILQIPKRKQDFRHFFGELYWTVFLLPVIVLPSIGVSAEGFLSILDVSASWQLFVMCGVLQISTATMIHLLIYRLKFAIPPDASYRNFIKIGADFTNSFNYFIAFFCTCSLGFMDEDQMIAKNRILDVI
uniref:Aa_trans domain-containing protein n=1 Tax=Caenorhabditis tropicalis TaxID=1561998 RepID=A0A1I7T4Z3_9PELO